MTTYHRLGEQINTIPLLDHHVHAPLDLPQRIDSLTLRAPFTESADQTVQSRDVPNTVAYRTMIRSLAALLECEGTEEAVLQARAGIEREQYHRMLADDAALGPLFNDYLFAESESIASNDWSRLTGREVRPLVRIETLAERLIANTDDWEEFRLAFETALAAAHGEGAVGFKSIAAYRSGLAIERIDAATASEAYYEVRAEMERGEFTRLLNKPLIDALIWETLEVASELQIPFQFHVGLGDDDVFMPLNNPTLMRAIFQEPRFRDVPVVLLHCYPFVREAAYLASVYPNAYIDLGLTVPLAGAHCRTLIEEALGVAPSNKILASTDGHGVPEFQWFAARLWRTALSAALSGIIEQDMITEIETIEIAQQILHANSERIYPR